MTPDNQHHGQHPLIWVLTDDRPGNGSQSLGVAEALCRPGAWPFSEKKIGYTSLAKLPNILRGSSLMGLTDDSVAQLAAPWPDVVIAAGRRTAPVARWIKKMATVSAKKTVLAQIMNPGVAGAGEFDLIAIPNHDCEKPGGDAANVLRITGAPHRFSRLRLDVEAANWIDEFSKLPRPFFALFVGGATKARAFPAALAADLGARTAAMAKAVGGTVLLSTSRRTGLEAEAALLAAIPEPRAAFVWSQAKPGAANPYAGFLAVADAVVVTGDSMSMCAEACAGAQPAYIYAPPGMVSAKHARFHNELYAKGCARQFDGAYEAWSHAPLNAADAVAARIMELMG